MLLYTPRERFGLFVSSLQIEFKLLATWRILSVEAKRDLPRLWNTAKAVYVSDIRQIDIIRINVWNATNAIIHTDDEKCQPDKICDQQISLSNIFRLSTWNNSDETHVMWLYLYEVAKLTFRDLSHDYSQCISVVLCRIWMRTWCFPLWGLATRLCLMFLKCTDFFVLLRCRM